MTNWKKNDAALIKWGQGYVMRRVLFITDDNRPVVKIGCDYRMPGTVTIKDPDWFRVGQYTRGFFWSWKHDPS